MPGSLVGMFVVFLVVPLTSLTFHPMPWDIWYSEGPLSALLVTVTYWIAPVCLCYAIASRKFLFLPVYILQCVALVVHTVHFGNRLPLDLLLVRYILVGCMTYIGFQFANKDFLYPFLTKSRRFWRKARRFDIQLDMEIIPDKGKERITARMENCSVTGLCIRVLSSESKGLLKQTKKGGTLAVTVPFRGKEFKFNGDVVWIFDYGDFLTVGLRVSSGDSMVDFVTEVTGSRQTTARPVSKYQAELLEYDVRQTAFVLWLLFIMLSFGMPAFA